MLRNLRSSSGAATARPTAVRPSPARAPGGGVLQRGSSNTGDTTRARADAGGGGGGGGGGSPAGLSEDVLARLRAAEQEAARLREELAQVQQSSSQQQQQQQATTTAADGKDATASSSSASAAAAAAVTRIDSTDSRELPWTAGKRTAWLSEADVTFFTGAGATEGGQLRDGGGAGGAGGAEEQGVVRRRLLQGALATAALAAFALVPTRALRVGAPSKPLFFYLVPLVRALDQLRDLEQPVEDADWPTLRAARARIVGPPGNARENLYDAVAALDSYSGEDAATIAKDAAKRAEALAGEVVEALDALDYNKYFDAAMMGAAPSGTQNLEFVKFTREARKAAEKGLRSFLALMPREAVEGARQVVAQQAEAMAAMGGSM
jgi:hypothetical protein